jgi:hypothetical protein
MGCRHPRIERRGEDGQQVTPEFVEADGIAEDNVRVRVSMEGIDDDLHRPREVEIVAVQVGQDLPVRNSKTLVDGFVHPAIWFRDPAERIGTFELGQQLECPIGGPAVHDDVLEIRIALRANRTERPLEEGTSVHGRGHDGDKGPMHGSPPRQRSVRPLAPMIGEPQEQGPRTLDAPR